MTNGKYDVQQNKNPTDKKSNELEEIANRLLFRKNIVIPHNLDGPIRKYKERVGLYD